MEQKKKPLESRLKIPRAYFLAGVAYSYSF